MPTFEQVAGQLRRAASKEELEAAAQLIQFVGGFDDQNRLGQVFKAKAAEFKQ
jgi:hypothetical protein